MSQKKKRFLRGIVYLLLHGKTPYPAYETKCSVRNDRRQTRRRQLSISSHSHRFDKRPIASGPHKYTHFRRIVVCILATYLPTYLYIYIHIYIQRFFTSRQSSIIRPEYPNHAQTSCRYFRVYYNKFIGTRRTYGERMRSDTTFCANVEFQIY